MACAFLFLPDSQTGGSFSSFSGLSDHGIGVDPPACGVTGCRAVSGVWESSASGREEEAFGEEEERSMRSSGVSDLTGRFARLAFSSAVDDPH